MQPSAFLFAPWVLLLSKGDVLITTAIPHPLLSLPKPKAPRGSLLPPRAQQGAASMAAGMAALWARAQAKLRDGRNDGAGLQPGRTGSSEDKLWVWCSLDTQVSDAAQPRLFPTEVSTLQSFSE